MAIAKLSDTLTRLGRRLPEQPAANAPDPDLLARFLADRDEAAFAVLVRRHGPMVFGVCRRVTGDHHLAEDAFQAVFVVLAAKAGSVHPAATLAAWLYAVAYRTALRARTTSDRRRRREALVGELPESAALNADSVEAADVAMVLSAEIARLPDHLRVPVVLCELEGRSRPEVAGQLVIPEGTLSSRLGAARKALATRLRGRGVALSAAGLTAALAQAATAGMPADLATRAVSAAITPGTIPAPVAALSNGVLRLMFAKKLMTVALGLVASALLAGGFLLAAESRPQPVVLTTAAAPVALTDEPKPVAQPAPKVAGKQLPTGPNRILFYRNGHLALIDPDGKKDTRVSLDRGKLHPGFAQLSPDGKRLAVLHQAEIDPVPPAGGGAAPRRKLYVRGLDEKEPGTDLGVECQTFFWSPDGSEIAYCEFVDGIERKMAATHGVVNVMTKVKTSLKLPEHHFITDWSRDGKYFLTTAVEGPAAREQLPTARLYLMNRDGTEHKALTDAKGFCVGGRLAADGKRVLFMEMETKEVNMAPPQLARRRLKLLDVATGRSTPVEDLPLNGELQAYCWSPDGKQIAYAWREVHVGEPKDVAGKETESFLVVCDPDGKNAKTIATEKAPGQWIITIGHVDWR